MAFSKSILVFPLLALFATACSAQAVQADSERSVQVIDYPSVLGKSLHDRHVYDFLADNHCSTAGPFQLCQDAGIALGTDASQFVNRIYLYSGNEIGFHRYRGKLPYGITFHDPMWWVMDKLKEFDEENGLTTRATAGLPDAGSSPDHMHYWAEYKRLNMIIIYDSPSADEDAYIYAIVVVNDPTL